MTWTSSGPGLCSYRCCSVTAEGARHQHGVNTIKFVVSPRVVLRSSSDLLLLACFLVIGMLLLSVGRIS